MLVLSRGKNQSVVIGDEITLNVEDIRDGEDGRCIFGATVRLGFQMPSYVSILRSELLSKRSVTTQTAKVAKRPRMRSGEIVDIHDARVRLQIQTPQKVPVCHNGTPVVGSVLEKGDGGETDGPKMMYHITCRKEDRIAICRNIIIAALDFHYFVSNEYPA
ncbi:MAG: carbon storage regulator [Pirellulales bacterium]|nr:carbon storage regulator [Pirellulales bacterium]